MGQNDELAGVFCVRNNPLFPKLNGLCSKGVKFFAYMAIIICLFASFSVGISAGQASSNGEAQDTSVRPAYVVFAIDASASMNPTLEKITANYNGPGFFTLNNSIDEILSKSSENKVGLLIWNTNSQYNNDTIKIELNDNKTELKNAVGRINSPNFYGNHTCLAGGLIEAREVLNRSSNSNCNKSIIFISDGDKKNCDSENNNTFYQIAGELNQTGIILYDFSEICNSSSNNGPNNENISACLSNVTKLAILHINIGPILEGKPSDPVPIEVVVSVGFISVSLFTIYFPLEWLPCTMQRPLRKIRKNMHQQKCNIFKGIRKRFDNTSCVEIKNVTCRGDMMIKKSVTKSVIPNVITIDSNGSASEDVTIEITLPTERCCIGADVAFAIDCSASMYHSDKDKTIRKAVVEPIIRELRRDSDRVALCYWKDGKLLIESCKEPCKEPCILTNKFDSALSCLNDSLSDKEDNFDKGGTNFNELLMGAMNSVYTDDKKTRPYTRSVIILSDAVPEGEDGTGGLKFNSGEMKCAIEEKENKYKNGGEKVLFYSVGIKPHPLGSPILAEISKLVDDVHHGDDNDKDTRQGKFVQIDEADLKVIKEKIKTISDELICQLIRFEKLKNIKVIDILPPYLKDPHDFKMIVKPINGRLKADPITPLIETNPSSYTTTIKWDLGAIKANGDIWKLTFKARLEFPIPTNMVGMGKEDVKSQIIYTDQNGHEQNISLDPGEIRFKAAIE